MPANHTDDLRLAHVLADDADSLTTSRFKAQDLHVVTKPDLTPVTDADRSVEEGIRRTLSRARPRDAVVGEEEGTTGHGSRRWVVDPIDGTKNFVRGVPVWATLNAEYFFPDCGNADCSLYGGTIEGVAEENQVLPVGPPRDFTGIKAGDLLMQLILLQGPPFGCRRALDVFKQGVDPLASALNRVKPFLGRHRQECLLGRHGDRSVAGSSLGKGQHRRPPVPVVDKLEKAVAPRCVGDSLNRHADAVEVERVEVVA